MERTNLQMEFLTIGNAPSQKPGQIAVVHYTGWLTDGTKFDSSVDRNEPFQVAAGVGQVIGGWDAALTRMRTGDKVRLTIPPAPPDSIIVVAVPRDRPPPAWKPNVSRVAVGRRWAR